MTCLTAYDKMVRGVFAFVLLSICSVSNLSAQQTNDTADTGFDLYLLIGQSNMAGRGEISSEYKLESDSQVMMLDKNDQWVLAKHPLHFDKPNVAGVGPGLSFGIEMARNTTRRKIGLIPCAVGGTSIDVWQPGGYDKATNTHPYDDAVRRLQVAMRSGTLKGVIWLQGESDSQAEKAKNYLEKLTVLISRIRAIANNPTLPFVAGELGRYKEQYQNINSELKKMAVTIPGTAVASSKKLKDKGDGIHYDSPSAALMGKRFAKQMIRLLKKANKLK